MKNANPDTIIDTLLWCKIWQLSGYNPTRENKNFPGDPEEPNEVLGSQRRKQKVIYTEDSLEFGKACE